MFSFLSCLERNFEALSAFPRRTSRSRDLKPWGKSCADHFHTCSRGWLHENTSDLTPLAAVLPADSVKHWLLTQEAMNNELNFPPNFEKLVLGCIDADFASK